MRKPVVAIILSSACNGDKPSEVAEPCVAVAVEEEGAVALLDGEGELLEKVDLSTEVDGMEVSFNVHNVQATADGRALVTLMPAGDHEMEGMVEQLAVLDLEEGEVLSRVDLGEDLHVAHVVTDGDLAWITAYEADLVLEVDLAAVEVLRELALPVGTGPHGLRRLPDGSGLVIAGMGDGSMVLLDLDTEETERWELDGRAVQAAVLPDSSAAFVSDYDSRQVARLDLDTRELSRFDLPEGAAGPVQVYPTPDSAALWVADQGYLEGDPAGEHLYQLDAATGELLLSAEVSPAPHGVVVQEGGAVVWTTTLVDGTVDRVDAASGEILSSTEVGDGPNGVTCGHEGEAQP